VKRKEKNMYNMTSTHMYRSGKGRRVDDGHGDGGFIVTSFTIKYGKNGRLRRNGALARGVISPV
jgi:hypothetical protein